MKLNTATPTCKLCFKEVEENSLSSFLFGECSLCRSCYFSLSPHIEVSRLKDGTKLITLFRYEEGFRNALYQFKGCGDIELSTIFLTRIRPLLNLRFHGYVLVPAPSSESHDFARGFNHVEEICSSLSLPKALVLKKTKEHKQSDLSAEERKKVKKVLALTDPKKVRDKRVLFIDDVYTTGSTTKACVELLKEAGAKKVVALVLAKVPPKGKGEKR